MGKYVVIGLLLWGALVSAKERVLTPEEWRNLEAPCRQEEDILILQNGLEMYGYQEEVPPLVTAYGTLYFDVQELAALAVVRFQGEKKLVYATRDGQLFVGALPSKALEFQEERVVNIIRNGFHDQMLDYEWRDIQLSDVSHLFFQPRGRSHPSLYQDAHSITLRNGDRFPAKILDVHLHMTDGWKDFTLRPDEIVDLHFSPEVSGLLSGEGLGRRIDGAYPQGRGLQARLARDGQTVMIPWEEISRIRADMGELVLEEPDVAIPIPASAMVYVPPGRFTMGGGAAMVNEVASSGPGLFPQGPSAQQVYPQSLRRRTLPSFRESSYVVEVPGIYVDRDEVTNAEYEAFVKATGHRAPPHWRRGRVPAGLERHPVVNVSYKDAEAYARWAGKRLPTEVEWERAAKGGAGTLYPYGDVYDPSLVNTESDFTTEVGKYAEEMGKRSLHPLSFANQIHDLSGNVAEWTSSTYSDQIGDVSPDRQDSLDLKASQFKVLRGGSYRSSAQTSTAIHRAPKHEDDFDGMTGFRCVRDAK